LALSGYSSSLQPPIVLYVPTLSLAKEERVNRIILSFYFKKILYRFIIFFSNKEFPKCTRAQTLPL
jgi:hypothetical protein